MLLALVAAATLSRAVALSSLVATPRAATPPMTAGADDPLVIAGKSFSRAARAARGSDGAAAVSRRGRIGSEPRRRRDSRDASRLTLGLHRRPP